MLNRIVDIDKLMANTEFFGKMRAQRLNAIPLGGMVARRNESDSRFTCQVYALLRYFAGKKGIHTKADRLFEITLSCAAAPGNAAQPPVLVANQQRPAPEHSAYLLPQR